jgi:hypothetical protein
MAKGFATVGGAAERALGGGGGALDPGRTNFGRNEGGGGGTDRGATRSGSLASTFAPISDFSISGVEGSTASGAARPAATGGFKGPEGSAAGGFSGGAFTAGA